MPADLGITTLLDLRVSTPLLRDYTNAGSCENGAAPFAAFEWPDFPTLFDPVSETRDQLLRCSCVQMDAASIYVVSRQVLDKEEELEDDDYQTECVENDSSMVMGMHFGDGALPYIVPDAHVIAEQPHAPRTTAEGSIADLLQAIVDESAA